MHVRHRRTRVQRHDEGPARTGDELVEVLLTGLDEGSPAASEHCVVYLVSRSTSDPDIVHITEGWTSQEEHARVFAGQAAKAIVARVGPLLAEESAYTSGVDEEFHKGENAFGRQYGDPAHHPNVNLGPIDQAPFYAIAVVPTPLGTSLGLRTNTGAQVLTKGETPIPGLYAVGNDAQAIAGSEYPGAGCQVGGGMTFGYVAAQHAANDPGAPRPPKFHPSTGGPLGP